MINPGRYDVGFNEHYAMQKLYTLDHYEFYLGLAWHILFFILFVAGIIVLIMWCWVAYKNESRSDEDLMLDFGKKFKRNTDDHLSILAQTVKCIKEDRLFGNSEKIIRARYTKDIIKVYAYLSPIEDYIVSRYPEYKEMFDICRNFIAKDI